MKQGFKMLGLFKKPFHKNRNREESVQWFSKQRHWKELSERTINGIIDRFQDEPLAFEGFVYISEHFQLVRDAYIPLGHEPGDSDIGLLFSSYASTLCDTGSMLKDQFLDKMNTENQVISEFLELYKFAMIAFESAMKLNEFHLDAYIELGSLRASMNQYAEALDYLREGLQRLYVLEMKIESELNATQKSHLASNKEIRRRMRNLVVEFEKELST